MKNIFLNIFTVIFIFTSFSISQTKPIGKIIFEKGNSMEFSEIQSISGHTKAGYWTLPSHKDNFGRTVYENGNIRIDYQGTQRNLPFSKLKSIRVESYKISQYNQLQDITAKIVMENDRTIETNFTKLFILIVHAIDDLTGELKEFKLDFVQYGKLNIREIVFY